VGFHYAESNIMKYKGSERESSFKIKVLIDWSMAGMEGGLLPYWVETAGMVRCSAHQDNCADAGGQGSVAVGGS
jgi:hypothetical protein